MTLAPLLDLADIADALGGARASFDAALRHRAMRKQGGQVAVEAGLRTARASAALEGHAYDLDELRAGTALDPVVQGALRVSQALEGLAPSWPKAPRQVLARLHMLAGRGIVPDGELGRPTGEVDPGVQARLDGLVGLVTGKEDTLLLAAVVHGELLALGAFGQVNGVVARAAARLTLIAGGFDLRGLLPIDVGHLDREPEYRGSQATFATGTPDGLRSWLKHYAAAVTRAAEETTAICDGLV
ncbi:oxidoreductase [Longispora sp. K20-0274]|uniref:oxidoreductase n=1 Tax=Longispora sp. K20-0274 TaxID=3088255 RepID=UPI00399B3249